MRLILLFVCCTMLGLSASAQWYRVGPLKKHQRFPLIASLKDHSVKHLPVAKIGLVKIYPFVFTNNTDYYLELAEASIMKTAQHNMRFHEYEVASYNFSALAELYIKQNRFSEAKWYLLQSNNISRQQNDDKHTIANLMDLAMVKANLGDLVLAQQDLTEARQIAISHTWTANIADVEKESLYIIHNTNVPRPELRYADAVLADKKIVADKKTD